VPVVSVLLAAAASADPVVMYVHSGSAAPKSEPVDVRMARETVTVELGKEARVKADMVFVNEGAAQTILMGFPQVTYHQTPQAALEEMAFTVDGEAVPSERLPSAPGANTLGLPEGLGVESWHVAKVPFTAGQERRVVISYRHRHGFALNGRDRFLYLLGTAKRWKGAVTPMEVVVHYDESVRDVEGIDPPGYQHDIAARRLTWHWDTYDGPAEGTPAPGEEFWQDYVTLRWHPKGP
jgi:hypothetical protein